jgi:hypothetical protein
VQNANGIALKAKGRRLGTSHSRSGDRQLNAIMQTLVVARYVIIIQGVQ